jgi:amino acid transporter
LNLASTKGTAAASPFVIAIERAGIKSLPSVRPVAVTALNAYLTFQKKIINACLITSASSAASSDIYTGSRVLCNTVQTLSLILLFTSLTDFTTDGLAAVGNAPKIFLKTSRNGLPYAAVIFTSLFALLGYMGTEEGAGRVFGWFANLTAVAGLMAWFGIGAIYLRFYQGLKAQGIDRRTLPYHSNLQPYAAWYASIACLVVSFVSSRSLCQRLLHVLNLDWPSYLR